MTLTPKDRSPSPPPPAYHAYEDPSNASPLLSTPSSQVENVLASGSAGSVAAGVYVYYRIYTPDGAINTKTAFDLGNPFVGRIKTTSVPPPHNVLSLKRRLGEAESLPDPTGTRTVIYKSTSATAPVAVVLGLGVDLGRTPHNALAFVFVEELSEKEQSERFSLLNGPQNYEPQYVHYRLHTLTGEDTSSRSFDPEEPALGRIDRLAIPPPNDVAGLKRCVAHAEGKRIYAYSDFYGDASEGKPWDDETHIDPGADYLRLPGSLDLGEDLTSCLTFPGSSPTAPLLLVQPPREPGLLNRPLKVLKDQLPARKSFLNSKLIWIAATANEVLRTDGVCEDIHHYTLGVKREGYMCVGNDGRKGWILKDGTNFLDV